MKRLLPVSLRTLTAVVGFGLLSASAAFGQNSATFSGRALDGLGRPVSHAVVRLVSDTSVQPSVHPQRYTLMGDSLGKFSQEGIAPGAYLVMLFTDGKGAPLLQSILLKAGHATVLDFNMGSRPQVQVAGTGSTLSMADRHKTSGQTR